MKPPGTLAATVSAARIATVRPRLRAVFLLASAALLALGSTHLQAQTPVFVNWPSSITNVWQNTQVTYTNATYPNGLPVSNAVQVSASFVSSSLPTNVTGFSFIPNPGWNGTPSSSGPGAVLLYFTPGTNPAISQTYTNTLQIVLTNPPANPPAPSVTNNIDIVITPPPPDYPVFTTNFVTTWPIVAGTNQVVVGPHFDSTNPANSPNLYPVADITNVTSVYALFLSNSLGETGCTNSVTVPGTNNTYLATSTGFGLNPAAWSGGNPVYTNVNGLNPSLKPSNPWQNATNPLSQASIYTTNNEAWIALPFYPGTNAGYVTNYIQILAYNGNNSSTANWTTNNIAIVVAPPLPTPPALEVRFYNSSTNADTDVYILPSSTDAPGSFGNGFWWSNSVTGSNNWTNWITNGNATVRLSDIGVGGTNAQGRPYYSIYTTNFPNAAWYLSYGGGNLPSNTTPPAPQSGQPWYGYEWAPFEVTLDGNPSDKCDTTYINQFSIPMTVRALTNDYASSVAGIYPGNSLAYYQICGFTNWTSPSTVAIILSNLATQLSVNFPNAAITNANGKTVMYAGPSSAGMGSLQGPAGTPAFPSLEAYFAAVKANGSRTNKIKDSIGLSGATNAGLGNNPVFMFAYDFDLVVTTSNTLLLTNGTINVTNQPGSTGTNLAVTSYSGLWMEIGADAGPQDSWASSAVYLAPTPANYVQNYGKSNVAMQTYTANASNGLAGTPVFQSSTNAWLSIATNTGTVSGTNRSIIADPTAYDLYESQFGTAVMGRILGDMAAGFALGFINSGTVNPAMGVAYGDSPSGSWWGGNEYPQADTVNSIAYSDVNTNYSAWGDTIYSATKVTYGHPIYDRMQFYGGGNATNPFQIQPSSATNNQVSGVGGSVLLPVWVVEVEFFNGLSSVGDTPTPPPSTVLTYSNWLTNYSSLTGADTNGTADPDGDGFDNNQEYAFGGNPTVGTPALLVMASSNISFIALSNAASNYSVQNTTNLATGPWTNYSVPLSNTAPPFPIPLPASYQGMGFTVPITPGTNNFYRVIFSNQ
jgi:hypothetical protein